MRRSWAVASTLFRQLGRSLRYRLLLLSLCVFALAAPRLGGGDLLDRLRLAVDYGIGLPVFVISLAAILIAAQSVAQEIERNYIHLLATKPIRASAILFGKLLGSWVLAAGLLLAVYAVVSVELWAIYRGESSPRERESAAERFFSARIGVFPEPRPIDESAVKRRVEARLSELAAKSAAAGREVDRERVEAGVLRELATRKLREGEEAELTFRGLPEGGFARRLQVRYEILLSPPLGATDAGTRWSAGGWSSEVEVRQSTPGLFEVPASAVEHGSLRLTVAVESLASGAVLVLAPESVELLYPYGSFAGNLGRGFLLLLGRFAFLAAIGIAAAAFFSLPTAMLLGVFVYLAGSLSAFLRESVRWMGDGGFLGPLASLLGWILELVPDLAGGSPVARAVDGRAIPADDFFETLGGMVLRSALLWAAASWYWSRRELGGTAR